jgi:hypothetical protein
MTNNDRQEALLSAWLDGNISEQDERELRALAANDKALQTVLAMDVELKNRALITETQSVPDWDRDATWLASQKQKSWNGRAFSMLSMAMSLCAMVLVLSNFQVEVRDRKLSFGFGAGENAQQELDIKLAELRAEQDRKLYEFAQEMKIQQLEANAKLVDYVLTSNRESRDQELNSLISYLEQQRKSDFNYINNELAKVRYTRYD